MPETKKPETKREEFRRYLGMYYRYTQFLGHSGSFFQKTPE